jgi:hypothetical protein
MTNFCIQISTKSTLGTKTSVVDPDSLNPDTDPIRIQGFTFHDQKLKIEEINTAEFFYIFFLNKNCNLLIPRP